MLRISLAVALGGALGALARYYVDGWVSRATTGVFPWGTFVINLTGAFLLGLLFTVWTERFPVSPWLRSGVTVGFIGAYTTFSTLTLETVRLLLDGSYVAAFANAAGSLVAGLLSVYAGIVVGRVI